MNISQSRRCKCLCGSKGTVPSLTKFCTRLDLKFLWSLAIDLHAAPSTWFISASDVSSGNCKYCFMISNKPYRVASSKSSKWTLIPTLCRATNLQISRQHFIASSFVGNPSLSKPATLMMSLGHLVCALGFLHWEVLHAPICVDTSGWRFSTCSSCAFESEDLVSDMAASTDPAKIGSKINHDDPIK